MIVVLLSSYLNSWRFFFKGDNVDFNDFRYNDIHLITCLLNLYLSQLPIPLITFEVYNKLIDAYSSNLISTLLKIQNPV